MLRRALQRCREVKAVRLAAFLTLSTIIAAVPFLFALGTLSSLALDQESALRDLVVEKFGAFAGPATAAAAVKVLHQRPITYNAGSAAFFAFLALLWGASFLFAKVRLALDSIWGLPTPTPPGEPTFWGLSPDRILPIWLVAATGFLLILSITEGVAGSSNRILWLGAFALAFLLIFRYAPSVSRPWPELLPGALATAFLFSIAKALFCLYLAHAADLGKAGSITTAVVAVYGFALTFVFGAACGAKPCPASK